MVGEATEEPVGKRGKELFWFAMTLQREGGRREALPAWHRLEPIRVNNNSEYLSNTYYTVMASSILHVLESVNDILRVAVACSVDENVPSYSCKVQVLLDILTVCV